MAISAAFITKEIRPRLRLFQLLRLSHKSKRNKDANPDDCGKGEGTKKDRTKSFHE